MGVGVVSSLVLSGLHEWLAVAALVVGVAAAIVYVTAFYRSKQLFKQAEGASVVLRLEINGKLLNSEKSIES